MSPRPAASMRVIVTRPAAQAVEWVDALAAQGIAAVALPLLGIAPASDPAPVAAAWSTLATRRLVVFVSPNAVERFFAHRPDAAAWPAATLAGSTGPGTSRALRRVGVAPSQLVEPPADAPQFDSEALWGSLAARGIDWGGASVLRVCGEGGGRDWLAATLRAQGAVVDAVASYRRAPPRLGADEETLLRAALDRPAEHLWFFSSSEAIDHLAAATADRGAAAWCGSFALATHPRIEAHARRLGFAGVFATRPALASVVACIQSLRP